jgi:hypothetical protein
MFSKQERQLRNENGPAHDVERLETEKQAAWMLDAKFERSEARGCSRMPSPRV